MKLFWAFIAMLALLTGTLLLLPDRKEAAPADMSFAATQETVPPAPPAPLATTSGTATAESAPPLPTPAQTAPAPVATLDAGTSTTVAQPQPAPTTTDLFAELDKLLKMPPPSDAATADASPARPTTPTASEKIADALPPTAPAGADLPPPANLATALSPETIAKFKEIVPARMRTSDDGWITLDERFNIRGQGTAEKPYELSWDLLVSASETFQPRMGKMRMPERIAMLDGKHVRVTGYVAFPIMATAQNEMLSMRNMWDGCCIGVPPTPYDAVEVRLAGEVTGKDRFTSFGTIEGKLSVDPYIKGNWLLGLYLMEGAKLTQTKEGTDPTKHGGM